MSANTPHPTPDFRLLFDSTLSPLLILAPDFTIVEVNRAYLTATRTERSIVGHPIFDVFPDNPDDPSANGVANLRRSLRTVVDTGRTDTMALQRYDIPTGEAGAFAERYWSPVNTPVLDGDGRVTHIIHRVEDVTDFVHLRQVGREQERAVADAQMRAQGMEIDLFVRAREIREVNEQLSRANADLDAAGRTLREEQRAKDRFIATLSHELRNPLAAATAASELLALDLPDGHPALSVLERQLATLVRMSNDLLDGTRAVTGRMELVRGRTDLRSVVDTGCADMRGLFGHEDRTLDIELPADPVLVDGDRLRLTQVLTNLLSNALKYTLPGGRTRVRLTTADGQARLAVEDDGIGFQQAQAEELFGVFMRAAPAGPSTPEGLGLGLAVVRTIVELHGGRITAHSDGPGTGASFRTLLPLAPSGTPEPRPATAGPPRVTAAGHPDRRGQHGPGHDLPRPAGAAGAPRHGRAHRRGRADGHRVQPVRRRPVRPRPAGHRRLHGRPRGALPPARRQGASHRGLRVQPGIRSRRVPGGRFRRPHGEAAAARGSAGASLRSRRGLRRRTALLPHGAEM